MLQGHTWTVFQLPGAPLYAFGSTFFELRRCCTLRRRLAVAVYSFTVSIESRLNSAFSHTNLGFFLYKLKEIHLNTSKLAESIEEVKNFASFITSRPGAARKEVSES